MLPHRPQFDPLDHEFARRVRHDFARQAAMATFGIRIADLGPGWVEFEFAPGTVIERLSNLHVSPDTLAFRNRPTSPTGNAAPTPFRLAPTSSRSFPTGRRRRPPS